MNDAVKSLEEVFVKTGWAAIWEAKGEARAKAMVEAKTLAIAQNMVKAGFPPETVISMTNLNAKKVKSLYKPADNNQ